MVYAYDNWAQLPTKDIYDTQMMAMAVNAAKDMYEKGQQDIKDFTKQYGDFISPFSKDMERYGEMVGGVKNAINQMYAAGIDPLRSAEGRAALSRLINSVNPAEFNMMRSNAKTGYAYLDAIQDLRRKGKYSEAQELFDIMQTGGLGVDKEGNNIYDFANFSTAGRNGWNSFMRTSPIEAATLQELTKRGYEGRTARLLSAADFSDPRLKNYVYDPKYEWSGYLYSDLLKGAPGAILSASADPRMRFFRDLAEKKVAASGRPYTQADVEAQFQRDVADANTWALIDPTRKADEYQKMAQANKYTQANMILNDKLIGDREDKKHKNAMELQRLKNEGKRNPGIPGTSGVFEYGDATQDQAMMSLVDALVGTMDEKDPLTGKIKKVTVNNASRNTVLNAYRSRVLTPYRKFMQKLYNSNIKQSNSGNPDEGVFGNNAFTSYLKKFGYIDTNAGFESSIGKKVGTNGQVPYSAADFDNIFTDAELLAMADGYRGMKKGYSHKEEIERVLKNRNANGFTTVDMAQLAGNNASGIMEGLKGSDKVPNKVPIILPNGSMVMFRAVNIKYGSNQKYQNTGRMWVPVGSPTLPKDYTKTKNGVRIKGLNPYTAERQSLQKIEETARYLQILGSQKNQNVGLPGDVEDDEIDPAEMLKYLLGEE